MSSTSICGVTPSCVSTNTSCLMTDISFPSYDPLQHVNKSCIVLRASDGFELSISLRYAFEQQSATPLLGPACSLFELAMPYSICTYNVSRRALLVCNVKERQFMHTTCTSEGHTDCGSLEFVPQFIYACFRNRATEQKIALWTPTDKRRYRRFHLPYCRS